MEHMRVFAAIKGVPAEEVEADITRILSQVIACPHRVRIMPCHAPVGLCVYTMAVMCGVYGVT